MSWEERVKQGWRISKCTVAAWKNFEGSQKTPEGALVVPIEVCMATSHLCTAYISYSSTEPTIIFQHPAALFDGLICRVSLDGATS